MWNLKQIGAIDFLSHEKTEIEIKQKETTLIYGKNITDRGFNSNGSGKSSILEIIYFCMTGNSLRKVKNKELIRNGQDQATTVIVLENPVISMTLKIVREVHAKKATKVKLYENDVLREDLQDLKPAETDKAILEHLEISTSDLANYYLISKEKYSSLLLSSDTQKKEVINRFSKADYIDAVFPKIEQDIEAQQSVVLKYTGVNDGCAAKIELLTEQIERLKEKDIDADKEKRIKALKTTIEEKLELAGERVEVEQSAAQRVVEMEGKKVELEKDLGKLSSIEDLYKEVDVLDGELSDKKKQFKQEEEVQLINSVDEVRDIVKKAKIDIVECDNLLKSSNTTLATLRKIEMGEIECPKCKHTFLVGDQELTLEECKEKIGQEEEVIELIKADKTEKESTLEESKALLTELENELVTARDDFNTSIGTLSENISKKRQSISEVERKESEIKRHILDADNSIKIQQGNQDRVNNQIKTLEEEIKDCETKIEEIKNEPNPTSTQIKELNNQIKEQEKTVTDNQKGLDKEQKELEDLVEWKVNFKRFKSFLANQSLTLIEQQANYFLDKMRCDYQVKIDGVRELASGKMKEEIAIEISRDSLATESFGKFSGGEKAKVDLSCILAMQTLINTSCKNGGLDLLFCDEILESADDEAMNSIATSLGGVDKTVLMIAQSQPSVDCNMLEVIKENKISNIKSYG